MLIPVGPMFDAGGVLVGGLIGAGLGSKLKTNMKEHLNVMCGIGSMLLGIMNITKGLNGITLEDGTLVKAELAVVITTIIVAMAIGHAIGLDQKISAAAGLVRAPMMRARERKCANNPNAISCDELSPEEWTFRFVTCIVLFCASGTGIFGSISEGLDGNPRILVIKMILDFVTAIIFATQLGALVSVVCIPQFIIFTALMYLASALFANGMDNQLYVDFTCFGGTMCFMTGFRMTGIKPIAIANVIPGFILVFPLSFLYSHFIGPFILGLAGIH